MLFGIRIKFQHISGIKKIDYSIILTFIPCILVLYIQLASQQMHCSDILLIPYSSYMFRRTYIIIRVPSFVCPAELR
jgi:hypothetical protein